MTFTSDHFRVHEAAPGVFALLAGELGTCISNAAVIDLGDKTIVVDSFMTLAAGDDLVAAVRALTGRDAFLAVTSHWHEDHTGSNQLFAGRPIVSTRRTMELIVARGSYDPSDYAEEIETLLDRAREAEAAAETEEERARARRSRAAAEALFADRERFRLTLPDTFVDDRLVIRGRDREAEVLTYGPGHTESDVFVHVPDVAAAVMGDLLWVEMHPRTRDGDPQAWAAALKRIAGLGAATFVPGHGDVGGREHIDVMASYLHEVDGMLTRIRAGELDAGEAPPPEGSEHWGDPHRFSDSLRALAGLDR